MLYVDVIVKQRSKVEELTYAVPASMVPYIRSGSLVSVPLRRRIVAGIVVSLRRSVSRDLKEKIKPLAAIERDKQLSTAEITVVRQLAQHYGASLGEVGFHALDQPFTLRSRIAAVSPVRPTFFQLPVAQRLDTYIRLITKHADASFVCIFAQKSFLEYFCESAKKSGLEVVVADETVRFRKAIESKLAANERYVIATTSSGAFLPLASGDGLIIDQPSHIGLKQQQRPYMRVKTIARIRAACEQLRLFYGDDIPETADILRFQKKEWVLRRAKVGLASLTVASRLRTSEVLLPSVQERIRSVSSAGGRCLVVTLARGWASALICRECGHLLDCPKCGRTLAVDRGQLICRYDNTLLDLPIKCPECRATTLHEVGEGVARIRAEIERLIPGTIVHELSSDQPVMPASGVVVATEKSLAFPADQYDLVVLASVDRMLGGVALNDRWELVRMVRTLGTVTKELLVQTFLPDDPIWTTAVGDLRSFFEHELGDRRTLKLPPYGMLVSVVAHGTDEVELRRLAIEVREQISRTIPTTAVGPPVVVPIGPKRFRANVTFTAKSISTKEKHQLAKSLPFAWSIDLEP